MNRDDCSFGKFMQTYMTEYNISKSIVAEALGESEQTIEAILNNDIDLSKEAIAILADLFELPFDFLSIIQDWSVPSLSEEEIDNICSKLASIPN